MTAIGGSQSWRPGAGPNGMPAGALMPSAPFTPEDYDSALVHTARGEALHAITHAHSVPDGHLHAWQSTMSFAETLMPMASTDQAATFLKAYKSLVVEARRRKAYPSRALWRICSLEMKRQKRLGTDDQLPMDKEDFGLEAPR